MGKRENKRRAWTAGNVRDLKVMARGQPVERRRHIAVLMGRLVQGDVEGQEVVAALEELSGRAGLELLKPAAENVLQRWPVSNRVNSSRAPDGDPTLIHKLLL
jgi:hypothetical protein